MGPGDRVRVAWQRSGMPGSGRPGSAGLPQRRRRAFWVAGGVALGFLELTLDHHQQARELLDESLAAMDRQGFAEPSCFPALPLAAEAAILAGDTEAAERILGQFERQGAALSSRWSAAAVLRGRGMLCASARETPAALRLLDDAAAQFQELRLPLESARTLLLRGRVARQARQHGVARDNLENALGVFDDHQCLVLADSTRAQLAKLGGRPPGNPGQLTPAESQIAELAASGLTNAQIAAAQTVSVKTVEAHLGRVFHKLAVRSRVELANALRQPR